MIHCHKFAFLIFKYSRFSFYYFEGVFILYVRLQNTPLTEIHFDMMISKFRMIYQSSTRGQFHQNYYFEESHVQRYHKQKRLRFYNLINHLITSVRRTEATTASATKYVLV